MPSSTFWGMQHLNENVLCAIRPIFSGPDPDLHVLLELCVVPLDSMLDVHPTFPLFHMRCLPEDTELIERSHYVHEGVLTECRNKGTERTRVAQFLGDWFDSLKLNPNKKIVPLGYDYASARIQLERWLGWEEYHRIFSVQHRDILSGALFINDCLDARAEPVKHPKLPFSYIAAMYKVEQLEKHTAASDCLTIAQTYKRMIQSGI